MDLAIQAPRVRAFTADVKARPGTRSLLIIAALSAIAVAAELVGRVHAVNPGARAALETTITLAAIFSAGLLMANLERRPQVPDLLLLCALLAALLADFVYRAAPALSGGVGLESGGGAQLGCELIVSLTFAAAAFAPRKTIPDPSRGLVAWAVVAGTGALILGGLLEQFTSSHWVPGTLKHTGITGHASHPIGLGVHVAVAAVLIVSALGFVARSRLGELDGRLLAGASLLLAGASLAVSGDARAGDGLGDAARRLAARGLRSLLASACVRYAKARRREEHAAIVAERERIARDLHDGLAQDLACIATQSQRLGLRLGPDHPLLLATRHALVASRGAITDLWASPASSTEAALASDRRRARASIRPASAGADRIRERVERRVETSSRSPRARDPYRPRGDRQRRRPRHGAARRRGPATPGTAICCCGCPMTAAGSATPGTTGLACARCTPVPRHSAVASPRTSATTAEPSSSFRFHDRPRRGATVRSNEIKVLVVDDHELFRRGIIELLEERGIDVVGEAALGADAIRQASALAPGVVLMDLSMPGMSGIEATQRMTAAAPLARVLVLTMMTEDEYVMNALLAGACGYLLKDAPSTRSSRESRPRRAASR